MTAFTRRHRPPEYVSIKAKLRSDDDIPTRAARIVDFMALTGDPQIIARHRESVAEILGDYAELDRAVRR